jgi:hypothetical protein
MRGGEVVPEVVPAPVAGGEIEGGKKKRSRSRSRKSTPWLRLVMETYRKHKSAGMTYSEAMKKAKHEYRK